MKKFKLVWMFDNEEEIIEGTSFNDAFFRAGYNQRDYLDLESGSEVELNVATATFDKV